MVKQSFVLLSLLFSFAFNSNAQDIQQPSLKIGDKAPAMRVSRWLKGTPVTDFKQGKVYVIEFWATWCLPCKAAMPGLSKLAQRYKEQVTVAGIDILENKFTTLDKVQDFVTSMGEKMDYNVGTQDGNGMVTGWLEASGTQGIPQTFVVNKDGRIAWIGHPKDLDTVLHQVLANTWDISMTLAKQHDDAVLAKQDDAASYRLYHFLGDSRIEDDLGKPDSALLMIREIVNKEPRLKFAPRVGYNTFIALLKTDPDSAYEYGKILMTTSTYGEPAFQMISNTINSYSRKMKLPAKIFLLGAEAYQADIDHIVYPQLVNISRLYTNVAEMYWQANESSKAAAAQRKAIQELRASQAAEMETLVSKLGVYTSK